MEVKNKKDERDHQKRLDKIAYLYKWDYIKKQKLELEKEAIAKFNRIIIGTKWAKHIYLSMFMKEVYTKIQQRKSDILKERFQRVATLRI